MIITLTKEKKKKIKTLVLNLLKIKNLPLGIWQKSLGLSFLVCQLHAILGPLFYRYLKNDKVTSLRLNKGNFDAPAKISFEGKQELE